MGQDLRNWNPEDEAFWANEGKKIANRNLWISIPSLLCGFAVVGIIYGAMAAMVQTDVKKLVAYSSVSHLGFIVLGIFVFVFTPCLIFVISQYKKKQIINIL